MVLTLTCKYGCYNSILLSAVNNPETFHLFVNYIILEAEAAFVCKIYNACKTE